MRIDLLVGHGKSRGNSRRYDSGAVGNGYEEFQIAKDIAKNAHSYLLSNFDVTSDLINYNANMSLDERIIRYAKKDSADCIVEFHLNSFSSSSATGTEVWHYPGDKSGQALANSISRDLSNLFGIVNRGAKATFKNLAIVDNTAPTAVLVETCFISNPTDVAHVSSADGQRKAGECIAKAIARHFDLTSKCVPTPEPTPEPTPTKKIVKGDKVKVLNAVQYSGGGFETYYPVYDVLSADGDRIVIGIGDITTAAINACNLEKVAGTIITPPKDTSYKTYTVVKNDSFWKIAEEQLGNGKRYKELASFNGMSSSDTIYAGQTLKLPD